MGAKLGQAIGGRARGGDDLVESHEINVTPFIDVMLVLLIIFMVRPRSQPSISASICRQARSSRSPARTSRCSSR